jgi:pSer/pThr/pTyr-binding forkhead associated (FHA) protein
MEASLIVVDGVHKGRVIPLPETIFLIGRDPQCHLRPHCPNVSRLHCAVAAWAGRVKVRDLKSSNGTLLNDHPIAGEVVVHDGDHLRIGALHFEFRIAGNEDAQPPPQVQERDVKWLLDSQSPPPALSDSTCEITIPRLDPAAMDPKQPAKPEHQNGKDAIPGVSAGGHMRAYLAARKRPSK